MRKIIAILLLSFLITACREEFSAEPSTTEVMAKEVEISASDMAEVDQYIEKNNEIFKDDKLGEGREDVIPYTFRMQREGNVIQRISTFDAPMTAEQKAMPYSTTDLNEFSLLMECEELLPRLNKGFRFAEVSIYPNGNKVEAIVDKKACEDYMKEFPN